MTLDEVKPGQQVLVSEILLPDSRLQAIRLGIVPGRVLTVHQQLPKGPVIVLVGPSKIALGRALAQHVVVTLMKDF
ncbi:MAG: ferrous iron transport protein A [Sulfobacillus thermosulfidooxidans]|uniref:Ferrous iron transporter FeoA-like domain-containing protein n=1 Tax=Sulfobacillus thermotolerans TaxID=338644 RepID=A0ABN5H0W3_9FIRM|nr:FeoA family protein [Sulfobacillus sp. hq2]AUW94216.1 hypothetical protein BXT84_09870 [Sulfobacillus thermotolerans]MCY0907603.1 FeoA family protein [Sulfobacillus thermotolerans]POB09514.1 hypothetical protein CO251_14915 [Sulfobacillus sp. hq2]PSR37734.1 MAG: ferrous iron transport protein A [Sulfobacillus thermosulfidooxidans]